jgi:glutamate racemase
MIGFVDSGYGGLSVFKACSQALPDYDMVYLGDNLRAPYGSLSPDRIYTYITEILDYMFRQGAELVVLACNTASAVALRRVQQVYLPEKYPTKRVLGVVIPLVEEACALISEKKIPKQVAVIGTTSTIASRAYEREFAKQDNEVLVVSLACPRLVPLIESDAPIYEIKKALNTYLIAVAKHKPEILILGCTHYSFLLKEIKKILPKRIKILDGPTAIAGKLVEYLARHADVESRLTTNGQRYYYTTGSVQNFNKFANKHIIGINISAIQACVIKIPNIR